MEDWTLKRRGDHNGLPLYEALGGRVTAIAIVKEPAIEVDAILDDSDRTIFGPVMIPDIRIFRDVGPNGRKQDCYWYFSAKTIADLQRTFTGPLKIGH